jgi:glutamate 5-kinase
MFIANGKKDNPISNMIKNEKFTHFFPKISSLDARKKWIIGSLNSMEQLKLMMVHQKLFEMVKVY